MNIQHDINLKPYTTFQFDCIADFFISIQSINNLQELIITHLFQWSPRLILWWGSNILLTKERFAGLVIKNDISGKEIINETDTQAYIRVWWWENRDDFVRRSIEEWYAWCENLVSIPGTVWAAPMQNIGAYGVEVWNIIKTVEYIDLHTWKTHILTWDECKFWYRDSIFKQYLKDAIYITHVTFILEKYSPETYIPLISYGAIQKKINTVAGDPLTPKIIATTIAKIRASKLPDWKTIGTAWSFFKNPIITEEKMQYIKQNFPEIGCYPVAWGCKLSAWQLIDLAWCKWIRNGAVWTYDKHALVLVHHGWGTGKDIVNLAKHIQEKVSTLFGIDINPEVNFY